MTWIVPFSPRNPAVRRHLYSPQVTVSYSIRRGEGSGSELRAAPSQGAWPLPRRGPTSPCLAHTAPPKVSSPMDFQRLFRVTGMPVWARGTKPARSIYLGSIILGPDGKDMPGAPHSRSIFTTDFISCSTRGTGEGRPDRLCLRSPGPAAGLSIPRRTGASQTNAGRAGFSSSPGEGILGSPGPRLSNVLSSLALHKPIPPSTSVLSALMAALLSRAHSTSSLPGLRVVLCPSPYCRSACLFYPQDPFSPFRAWLQCHCLPKVFHYPLSQNRPSLS